MSDDEAAWDDFMNMGKQNQATKAKVKTSAPQKAAAATIGAKGKKNSFDDVDFKEFESARGNVGWNSQAKQPAGFGGSATKKQEYSDFDNFDKGGSTGGGAKM